MAQELTKEQTVERIKETKNGEVTETIKDVTRETTCVETTQELKGNKLSKREMQHEEYYSLFSEGIEIEIDQASNERHEKLLEKALDIRKFEIDLYWRRAAYFWAFTAAIFGGYFLALRFANGNYVLLSLICCLGFAFSFSWFLVNKASKYWQENWEMHVDMLEDKVYGPLYKLLLWKKRGAWCLGAAYPFSVSKINQYLSFFVTIVWLFLALKATASFFYWQDYLSFPIKIDIFWFQLLEIIVMLVGTIVFVRVLYVNARTDILCNLEKQLREDEKESPLIIVKRPLPPISKIILDANDKKE